MFFINLLSIFFLGIIHTTRSQESGEIRKPQIVDIYEFDLNEIPNYFTQFEEFFTKEWYDDQERMTAYEQFEKNIKMLYVMSKFTQTVKYAINEYSHVSLEEFTDLMTGFNDTMDPNPDLIDFPHKNVYEDVMPNFSLQMMGEVAIPKKQIVCRSSYVQSAISLLESQCTSTLFYLPHLSIQQPFDCESAGSCKYGGMPHLALRAMMRQGGVCEDVYYPYKPISIEYDEKNCSVDPATFLIKITGVYQLKVPDEEALLTATISYGSLITAIYVSESVKNYRTGVLDPTDCDFPPNHNVVIVGYGVTSDTNMQYWHLLNSWGSFWGEGGSIRLVRGKRACNIGTYVVTATVDTMIKHNVSTMPPVIPPNLAPVLTINYTNNAMRYIRKNNAKRMGAISSTEVEDEILRKPKRELKRKKHFRVTNYAYDSTVDDFDVDERDSSDVYADNNRTTKTDTHVMR